MSLTKSEIKTAIENNVVLPQGEVNLIDLREAVEEIRNACIDEFDAAWSGDADGTISTDLLTRYMNILGYESVVETLPQLRRKNS